MDMYVRMYDDLKRTEGDNPTVGIVLCSETSRDIARYSVLHDSEQLFAAKYMPLSHFLQKIALKGNPFKILLYFCIYKMKNLLQKRQYYQ